MKFLQDITLGKTTRIIKAQRARGVDFESGNPFRRAKNIVPILTPLFHSVFQRADDRAVALMARGYASGAKRTHLHELRIACEDYWVLAALLGSAILEMKIYILVVGCRVQDIRRKGKR
jgi:energy-coupling factor transport system permease protein